MKPGNKILFVIIAIALTAIGALYPWVSRKAEESIEEQRAKVFTQKELDLIASLFSADKMVRIGHIPDTPPLDMGDGSRVRKGLTWDYVTLLEKKLGLRFKRVDCDNWQESLKNREIDLVGSIQKTPERAVRYDFSTPYRNIRIFILARKDSHKDYTLENMKGMKIAIVNGTALHDNLLKKKAENGSRYGFTLHPVADAKEGMRQVAEGRVDAMVADGAVSRYYMPTLGLDLRVAGETDYSWNLCFAVRRGGPLPASIINKALGMISEQERRAIEKRWPTLLHTVQVERTLLLKIIGISLMVTLLAIGGVVLWNRTLRKQISDHRHELGRVKLSHAEATRALDQSEERFRILIESSNDMIWEMDRYGTYTYVSPRVQSILGYSPEELTGKNSTSLMIPADAARKMEQLRRRTLECVIDCEINTYIHRDGRKIILESSGMAFADNTAALAGFRGVSRDITDRIAGENALRHSEERFRNLVETTTDWIWEIDNGGSFTYLSPQSSDLLGYGPDELIGKHFTLLMGEKDAAQFNLLFRKFRESGKPIQSMVNSNRHRDNHTIVVLETSAVPFYDKEWNIQGYRGISRDITQRVATEKQLAFERNLFQTFMEHAPDLIYFKDADGRFIEINTAKAEELRRPPEQVVGKTDFDFFPQEQAEQKFKDEQVVMQTRKPLQKEETATTPDGDRWYLTTKVPRYDEAGNVVGTFGTSWDITYRKQAEEELRRLRALLSNTIDSMPSILVGVDSSGRVIQWNRKAEATSGLKSAEVLGLHLRNAFPELSREMVKVERAIREHKPQLEERIRVERNGRPRYHDITVFPLEGNTEGAVIRVDDVTDRVLLEDSIRNIVEGVSAVGRRFFGSMVTQLSKTLGADFTFISEFTDDAQKLMRTIAVSDGGVIGPNFEYEAGTTPCGRVLENRQCTFMQNVRELYPQTDMLVQKDVKSYIGIPLLDSENKALGIMVAMYKKPLEEVEFATAIMQVFAGRTAAELERMQATKELIALQDLLENIINSMPSVLIGVDAERRVMQWNRGAEELSGIEAGRAQGQPVARVLPPLGVDVDRLLDILLSKGPQHHERIQVAIDGQTRIIDVTAYPITADALEGAVIRLDEVTDRVRIEDMMVQSEKMMSVGGLAAGMAHEINNPLAGILQNMQVIRNRINIDSERNINAAKEAGTTMQAIQSYMHLRGLVKMFDSTAEAGQRAARIVDNMLSFSRKDESHFTANDLQQLVERSVELASNDYNLKKRFDFRHIRIVRDYEELPPLPCESSQIQQVLLNLLSNSAQAMAEQKNSDEAPMITIRIRKEPEAALIEVEDNGPGMDGETRKRVFEPFFTTKEVGRGTGLGLSVSYFIITENHGGSMHLDSAPGEGACFSIRIPFEHRTARWGLRL